MREVDADLFEKKEFLMGLPGSPLQAFKESRETRGFIIS